MQIENNVFVVTGGASGLGAASARMLASAGARVVLADMQEDAGQALAGELGCEFVLCDVTSEVQAKAVIDKARTLGPLRGLLNCAGIAPATKVVGKDGVHSLEAFHRVVGINLVGTFNMCRLAAEAMSQQEAVAQGERGIMINTASVAAFEGQMGQAAYSASKAGVVGMTLPLARDLSSRGIRVMTIAPGLFETPMLLGMPAQVQEALGAMVPYPPRLGKPEEYAHLARTIIENVMLNGETIRLDGAIRLQPK